MINVLDLISAVSKMRGGKLEKLSQQQLYDCGYKKGWCPCGTVGNISDVFYDVMNLENSEIDTEEMYPFTKTCDHICRSQPSQYFVNEFAYNSQGTEDQLLEIIQNRPLVTEITADVSFMDYTGGIYDDPNCTGDKLNHVVLLVGYGYDQQTQQQYWIIRNSWGTSWGENGYMRIAKGKSRCGIGKSVAYM